MLALVLFVGTGYIINQQLVIQGEKMDKTITGAGLGLVALGVGFVAAKAIDPTLHEAFLTGGYLWLLVGAATSFFGLRTKKGKSINLKAKKMGAI